MLIFEYLALLANIRTKLTGISVFKFRRGLEILKYGRPTSFASDPLFYDNHVLEFDPQRKTPKWVAEHITRQHVEPTVEVGRFNSFVEME